MDITTHLTDNYGVHNSLYHYYINGDSSSEEVEFSYEFLFNNRDVVYNYKKDSQANLLYEELYEDEKLLFKYDYRTNIHTNNITEALTVDLSKRNNNVPALKYIYSNTLYWSDNSSVKLLMNFVQNMLWFRSLRGNEFIGVNKGSENLNDYIIRNDLLGEFQKFLKDCGQDYKLCVTEELGKQIIGVKYSEKIASFAEVASTGTTALWLFFYWMNRKNISFVYLDEFDAFYHYNLSKYILNLVNSRPDFQSVLTSHNIFLISNDLMRPDCYALLDKGKITSFADSTDKTIRQAHNLEKMLLGGEFEN